MSQRIFLFDMDGILIDSMPLHARSWLQTAKRYGLDATESDFYLYEGMRGKDTVSVLYRRTFGEEAPQKLIDEIYHYKTSLYNSYSGELRPIPYTHEVMSLLDERGCPYGVVTGGTKYNAYPRIHKLYNFIPEERIITAESVTKGKPHPQPYLRGMELFGKTPSETVVVENAPLGIESGHASGALTIAVATGPVKEFILREAGADLLFLDMKALWVWCKENI